MRIAWVADFTVKTYKAGGAQYTNEVLINAGLRRGHLIDVITPDKEKTTQSYELYILNNLRYFTEGFIMHVVNNEKYVRFFAAVIADSKELALYL